jgi:hypothetical protein
VNPNVSAIERAFQLARAGNAKDMKGLKDLELLERAARRYALAGKTAPINYGICST